MALVGGILAAFYLVAVAAAMVTFGTGILPIAIVGSILLIGVQYKVGKWAALRSVGAEELSEQQYSEIHRMVEKHADGMGIDKPELKIARMGVPNAFAVGRKGAGIVVVSEELLQLLDRDELEGVLAHELAHIANRDVVTMQLGQGIASIVGIVAQFAVLLTGDNDIADFFLAIVVGNVVQFVVMIFVLAISRYREYVADADAKRAIGGGDPLARALEKISQGNQRAAASSGSAQRGRGDRRRESNVDQQVSALCISSPDTGFLQRIVSTHPPMEKRIERLRS
ncbi:MULTISPECIES: M48 family metallopeptidase [Halolamina]|uniref:Heat shock protein HtpX n=1 Tax=Halolamina pelagica TaxID=699431 RepID=A0A1I5QBZ5_9EURY|nr:MULTISPECIES: M48 family metalloprotease [Halolamina]NHX35195.1 M48 family metalloprotease [Halolamina sp. R1-12]SFP43828.1 heat shock protein HtpX [Halolamina pelagica]